MDNVYKITKVTEDIYVERTSLTEQDLIDKGFPMMQDRDDGFFIIHGSTLGLFYCNRTGDYEEQMYYPPSYEGKDGTIYIVLDDFEDFGSEMPLDRFTWDDEDEQNRGKDPHLCQIILRRTDNEKGG